MAAGCQFFEAAFEVVQKNSGGGACVTANGCTGCGAGGICVPNCAKKKNRNCQLGSGHGATSAR